MISHKGKKEAAPKVSAFTFRTTGSKFLVVLDHHFVLASRHRILRNIETSLRPAIKNY